MLNSGGVVSVFIMWRLLRPSAALNLFVVAVQECSAVAN